MLAGPAGCLQSRWRSSPWKWRNNAVPRGRGQKAPSTTRCIKTRTRKTVDFECPVRKHPAPQGALRLTTSIPWRYVTPRQKAPSTTRCIKTGAPSSLARAAHAVRKHPAPEGALRRDVLGHLSPCLTSESTPHHKVHGGIYRRAPGHRMPIFGFVRQHLDILSSRTSSRSHP